MKAVLGMSAGTPAQIKSRSTWLEWKIGGKVHGNCQAADPFRKDILADRLARIPELFIERALGGLDTANVSADPQEQKVAAPVRG
ncbi:hypothetical protein [Phyllobacterium myrsinacearum]|uniref:hypothetical protein n=1 Tax=Phyllobacterium myrsinacearum TaxID=28101 RepID=UPI001FE235F5|nr:hypothetical protein [Phyllobacterium myrsinacearum]